MSIRRRLAAPHPHRTEFLSDSGYALSGREFHLSRIQDDTVSCKRVLIIYINRVVDLENPENLCGDAQGIPEFLSCSQI